MDILVWVITGVIISLYLSYGYRIASRTKKAAQGAGRPESMKKKDFIFTVLTAGLLRLILEFFLRCFIHVEGRFEIKE